MKKALIVILLLVLVGGYFFAGYSVYTQATLVECAVPEVDQNNRPDNFSLSDKDVFWDPSEYSTPVEYSAKSHIFVKLAILRYFKHIWENFVISKGQNKGF